jgi:hypothetical protein
MAITFRTGLGRALYHSEMDANFSSLFYSSSLHDGGGTLRLWFDNGTAADTWQEINLSGAGTTITIANNVNNNILTATGLTSGIQGESDFTFDPISKTLGLTGRISMTTGPSKFNIFIGESAGPATPGISAISNILIGAVAGTNLTGGSNTVVGVNAVPSAVGSSNTVAVGTNVLVNLGSGNSNTAIGQAAGYNNTAGSGNVYIGKDAGKTTPGGESNQLYIANAAGTPLISGNFSTGQIMIQGGTGGITASFKGDGSGLTGVGAFPYTGSAIIKGTLLITGSNDAGTQTLLVSGGIFTSGSTSKISGSFSGSFYGDGSNLTGVPASTWNGIRNPDAQITGSIRFTGSLDLSGSMTISGSSLRLTGSLFVSSGSHTISGSLTAASNIRIHNPAQNSMGIGFATLGSAGTPNTQANNTAIGFAAGLGATGAQITAVGSEAGRSSGNSTVYIGYYAGRRQTGANNTVVGNSAFIGQGTGIDNTALGNLTLSNNVSGNGNTSIGTSALKSLSVGTNNTALGNKAGENMQYGDGNVYIGPGAGPTTINAVEYNQLYIANQASGTPLISGNFENKQIKIAGGTGGITASFNGNGSGLTNLNPFPYVGTAVITGSLTITGSAGSVRQLIVSGGIITSGSTSRISGSFSGSFYGDGSNLTGIPGTTWNGIRNGNAQITGSLRVSGSVRAQTSISISQTGSLNSVPGVEFIHFYESSDDNIVIYEFPYGAGKYTGFKMDYCATSETGNGNPSRVGTYMATWDENGDYFGDGVDTNTGLQNGAPGGAYDPQLPYYYLINNSGVVQLHAKRSGNKIEINAVITAFKRSIV